MDDTGAVVYLTTYTNYDIYIIFKPMSNGKDLELQDTTWLHRLAFTYIKFNSPDGQMTFLFVTGDTESMHCINPFTSLNNKKTKESWS